MRREFHVDPLHEQDRYSLRADAEIYVSSRSFEPAPGARALRNAASVNPSLPKDGLRAVICVDITGYGGNAPSVLACRYLHKHTHGEQRAHEDQHIGCPYAYLQHPRSDTPPGLQRCVGSMIVPLID